MTTETPGPTTTASMDWMSSLDPLATSTPSAGQRVDSLTAWMKLAATKGGYRFHGRSARAAWMRSLMACGTSNGLSFWLSLMRGSYGLSVYAPSVRTDGFTCRRADWTSLADVASVVSITSASMLALRAPAGRPHRARKLRPAPPKLLGEVESPCSPG